MSFKQCEICFSTSAALYIDIFGEVNSRKNVSAIIEKHLWLEFKPSDEQQVICNECWNSLYEFNNFYETVKEIHNKKDSTARRGDIFGEDPFGDDHFSDNGVLQKTATEFLIEVKDEPLEEPEKNTLEAFTASELDSKGEEISEGITTRRSSRLQRKCVTGPPVPEKANAATERLKRYDTRTVYNEDTSSEDERLGFSASDESDDDDENYIILNRPSKDFKTKSSSETENETKNEDVDGVDAKYSKARRAKRKRDSKLFAHIDEFICYVCPERVEFETSIKLGTKIPGTKN